MATIQSTIALQDNFSGVLNNIVGAVNNAVGTFNNIQTAMDNSMDTSAAVNMEHEINNINETLESLNETQERIADQAGNTEIFTATAAQNSENIYHITQNTEAAIQNETSAQKQFNKEIQKGEKSASGMKNLIMGAVAAYTGYAGIRKAVSWIQECTAAFDKQINAENQLMTVLRNTLDADYVASFVVDVDADTSRADAAAKALQAEFDAITSKASEIQKKGIYGDEAMIAAGAEFATYFKDVDAITSMMDTLSNYAAGMSGGGAIDNAAMVQYATNLGKMMTGSFDAMTKKGFEFTDAQKAIIQGSATQEQIAATLGEEYLNLSADMQAAAAISQVIGQSWDGLYESISNTPEGKLIKLNNAWGDMKETVGKQLYPYIMLFVDAITSNGDGITGIINNITAALQLVMGVLSSLVKGALNFASAVANNWDWISPFIKAIAVAMGIYYTNLLRVRAAELAGAAIKSVVTVASYAMAAATGAQVTATTAATAAQMGLNAALLACPITWIIAGIIAIVAAVYAIVAALNKWMGTTISVTGIVAGLFAMLGAHIINTFVVPVWNMIAALANFFGNVWNDPVNAVKVLFYDMCLTVLGYLKNLAGAVETLVNKIPGVTVDITTGLTNFYSELSAAQAAAKDASGWQPVVEKMDYVDYRDSWNAGESFGEGIESKIANLSLNDLFGVQDIQSADERIAAMTRGGDVGGGMMDPDSPIAGNIGSIADNTGSMAKSMEASGEELKYLRDIAEQETINRYTTAEIKIEQTNNNNVASNMDLNSIIDGLTTAMNDAIEVAANGVHV